ncbi:hypothetical protein [Paenibacillus rigui]|uniref:HNH nuclease domain-containing protein n=1 Tax=Paenibacillus rigui TaxID=554312 RepID=A0A229UM76_9BACL|nr:hypothetical protein [Paenibacillus rigui]OXM83999.1 hypothetical protein CF651_23085 [Paenibacillus rigui]
MNLSSQPVRSCSKEWQTRGLRNKPTQRQMGSISPKVDKQLKERSEGICELCTAAKAVQRAHITGRKQIDHRTTVDDLLHVCLPCHKWLDESVEGIKHKRKLQAEGHQSTE